MSRRLSRRRPPEVAARAEAVVEALDVGGHRLDPDAARRARALVSRIGERTRLSGDHTVVALAGATGSGKSSLFNALARLELAPVGVRRPTTSTPMAVVWGSDGADPLLDWLEVPRRHRTSRESALDAHDESLEGLVLLDLPDHDSTAVAHQLEVDRLVELVDVFVWVTDPQKYADNLLHQRYLSRLAGHDTVTLVVLNQSDRLGDPDAVEQCRADLQRLVRADGLRDAEVLVSSAIAPDGVTDLREAVSAAVRSRAAWRERLAADLDTVVADLGSGISATEPDPGSLGEASGLVAALRAAAGVPAVLDAVEADYRRGAALAGGWPLSRWVASLRPDPARRLRLRLAGPGSPGGTGRTSGQDRTEDAAGSDAARLQRSGLPAPTPAQRSQVRLATRAGGDAAARGLPRRWADAARAAAEPGSEDLADSLDQAVVRTDLGLTRPRWWQAAGAGQALLAGAALVGAGWLVLLSVLGWLRVPQPDTPYAGPLPVPTLLLLGGLALGVLLGVAVSAVARPLARRRRDRAARRLDAAVADVAEARVLGPVAAVLEAHRATREALARAQR